VAKFQIYFNLRTHVWSIRQRGRVVAHAPYVVAKGCSFHVGESSRLAMVAKGQRSVHAWVTAESVETFDAIPAELPEGVERVTYNPYRCGSFHRPGDTGAVVTEAEVMVFAGEAAAYTLGGDAR
jgi:hypothetical protein